MRTRRQNGFINARHAERVHVTSSSASTIHVVA